jgi:AcrR family transcriptional regulator
MQETNDFSPYRRHLKTKIMETAMKAFRTQGVRRVRMDDIAEELSISKRTVYEIFGTKERLVYECVVKYKEDESSKLSELAAHCLNVMEILLIIYKRRIENTKRTNILFYLDLRRYSSVMQLLKERNEYNRELCQRFIKRGIEEGYFRPSLDAQLTSLVFDALGRYLMDNHLYERYSIEEIYYNLVFVSLRGMCTEKGLAELERIIG